MGRKSIVLLVGVATAALIAAAIAAVYWQPGTGASGVGPASLRGSPAQSFTVPRLDDHMSSLNNFRGRLVVLNLWASWCPPCRAELPDLQRLYDGYRGRNVVVIAVNEGESAERAGAFARALRVHFPIFLDENQSYGRVYAALGLPTTVIINPAGRIVQGFDGALTFDQMKAAVVPLL
ncbi:MAG: TlpA family protein disulfide reductase [Candidatus Eremiobacteraeota bacterium]|nr:TlpA family protein disulfide reductase [Candidatus Eremiobacteraeota bacterium]